MKTKLQTTAFFFLILSLFVSSCGTGQSLESISTPTSIIPTSTSTAIATATATAKPTRTALPPTITSTPGPELDTADGSVVLRKAEIVDFWPADCTAPSDYCSQTYAGYEILVIWLEPVNGEVDLLANGLAAATDNISVIGDDGSETSATGAGTGLDGLTMVFTPPITAHEFSLRWHDLDPIPFTYTYRSDDLAASSTGGTRQLRMAGQTDRIVDVAWSPDDSMVASASSDGSVFLWDAATGKQIKALVSGLDYALAVAWSPNGSMIAVNGYDIVILFDAKTQEEIWRLNVEWVRQLSWSPDSSQLAVDTRIGEVIFLNPSNGEKIKAFDAPTSDSMERQLQGVAWSPDGSMIAAASYYVYIWDVKTEKLLQTLKTNMDIDNLNEPKK